MPLDKKLEQEEIAKMRNGDGGGEKEAKEIRDVRIS
jgi:hypothetical protein